MHGCSVNIFTCIHFDIQRRMNALSMKLYSELNVQAVLSFVNYVFVFFQPVLLSYVSSKLSNIELGGRLIWRSSSDSSIDLF